MKRQIATLLLLAGIGLLGAVIPSDTLNEVRHWAIQHSGRVKPVDSYAREVLEQLTGEPRLGREEPVATLLSLLADSDGWQEREILSVPFVPLREALGLDRKATHVSYSRLISEKKLMRMLPEIVEKQSRDEKLSMLENETMDLFGRFVLFTDLLKQKLHLVPPASAESRLWVPVLEPAGYSQERQNAFKEVWGAFLAALREGNAAKIQSASSQLGTLLRQANPPAYLAGWRLRMEAAYNRLVPFQLASALYLAAALFLLLGMLKAKGPSARAGLLLIGAGFLIHGAGIASRVILGGRPPVSNFYETMLWIPFVAVAVSLVFERIYRSRYFALAAAILAALTLALADRVPLDSSITPVVAVLRSNLWLTIHVLTIVASYGALALATVMAHLYAVQFLAGRSEKALQPVGLFLYRCIQVGVVLLAAGIMLGGVWANASWGRYWGWDPKETWALITLLWFLAVLHGRFAGWIKGIGLSLATIGGFFLLLMTYYGVSFYLVGLHSYAGGSAKPLPVLLVGYLAAEAAFIGWIAAAAGRRRKTA